MELAIGWSARYLAPIDQQERRDRQHSLSRVVQVVAWHRSADRELEWIARRLRLAPATVRRRNRRGLDAIALGLQRQGAAVLRRRFSHLTRLLLAFDTRSEISFARYRPPN
jgi:hypothetical protein